MMSKILNYEKNFNDSFSLGFTKNNVSDNQNCIIKDKIKFCDISQEFIYKVKNMIYYFNLEAHEIYEKKERMEYLNNIYQYLSKEYIDKYYDIDKENEKKNNLIKDEKKLIKEFEKYTFDKFDIINKMKIHKLFFIKNDI